MIRGDFKIREKEVGDCRQQESSEPGLCALRLSSRTVRTAEGARPKPGDRRYEHSLEFPKASGSVWHSVASGKIKRPGKKAGQRDLKAEGLKMESLKLS